MLPAPDMYCVTGGERERVQARDPPPLYWVAAKACVYAVGGNMGRGSIGPEESKAEMSGHALYFSQCLTPPWLIRRVVEPDHKVQFIESHGPTSARTSNLNTSSMTKDSLLPHLKGVSS